VAGKSGPEDTEQVAILDLENNRILAVQPQRQGQRVSTWTWENDRVQVASIDGVTDEFALRSSAPTIAGAAAAAAAGAAAAQRREPYESGRSAAWSPWNDPFGGGRAAPRERRQVQSQPQRRRPRSLFDLLFN